MKYPQKEFSLFFASFASGNQWRKRQKKEEKKKKGKANMLDPLVFWNVWVLSWNVRQSYSETICSVCWKKVGVER